MLLSLSIKNRVRQGVLILTSIVFGLALIATTKTNVDAQGSGLSISPTRTELSLEAGTADKIVLSIKNITSGPILAKMFVNDFETDNETSEPKLITDPNIKSAASISSFISGLEDVTLQPEESKDVVVDISIPVNAAPGGYYGAIRFQASPINSTGTSGEGSQVSLTANLLSLVLVEVPGDIEQKVEVSSVKAYLKNKAGSLFTSKPDQVGVEVKNQGNSFIKPFGRVSVKNMQGKEVFTYELNNTDPRGNVLPDSTRVFKDRLANVEKKTVNGQEVTEETSPLGLPGRYTVTANVSYGTGGEVFTISSSFWYLPVWFILTIVGVLIGLAGGAYMLYKRFK